MPERDDFYHSQMGKTFQAQARIAKRNSDFNDQKAKLAQAVTSFQEAIRLKPDDQDYYADLARAHINKASASASLKENTSEIRDALSAAAKACESGLELGEDPRFHICLGKTFFQLAEILKDRTGDYDDALQQLLNALDEFEKAPVPEKGTPEYEALSPDEKEDYLELEEAYSGLRDTTKEIFDRVATTLPTVALKELAPKGLGMFLDGTLGKLDAARAKHAQAQYTKEKEEAAKSFRNLLKSFKKKEAQYEHYTRFWLNRARVTRAYAEALISLEDTDGAANQYWDSIKYLGAALKLRPRNPIFNTEKAGVHTDLAILLTRIKEYDAASEEFREAIKAYYKVLKVAPGKPEYTRGKALAHFKFSLLLQRQKNLQGAKQQLRTASRLYTKALEQYAKDVEKGKDISQAETRDTATLRADTTHMRARVLAKMSSPEDLDSAIGEYVKAIRFYEGLEAQAESDGEKYRIVAKRADACLEQAVLRKKRDRKIPETGRHHGANIDVDKAKELLEAALDLYRSIPVGYTSIFMIFNNHYSEFLLAEILESQGELDAAIFNFRYVIHAYTRYSHISEHTHLYLYAGNAEVGLAKALERRGNPGDNKDARNYYSEALKSYQNAAKLYTENKTIFELSPEDLADIWDIPNRLARLNARLQGLTDKAILLEYNGHVLQPGGEIMTVVGDKIEIEIEVKPTAAATPTGAAAQAPPQTPTGPVKFSYRKKDTPEDDEPLHQYEAPLDNSGKGTYIVDIPEYGLAGQYTLNAECTLPSGRKGISEEISIIVLPPFFHPWPHSRFFELPDGAPPVHEVPKYETLTEYSHAYLDTGDHYEPDEPLSDLYSASRHLIEAVLTVREMKNITKIHRYKRRAKKREAERHLKGAREYMRSLNDKIAEVYDIQDQDLAMMARDWLHSIYKGTMANMALVKSDLAVSEDKSIEWLDYALRSFETAENSIEPLNQSTQYKDRLSDTARRASFEAFLANAAEWKRRIGLIKAQPASEAAEATTEPAAPDTGAAAEATEAAAAVAGATEPAQAADVTEPAEEAEEGAEAGEAPAAPAAAEKKKKPKAWKLKLISPTGEKLLCIGKECKFRLTVSGGSPEETKPNSVNLCILAKRGMTFIEPTQEDFSTRAILRTGNTLNIPVTISEHAHLTAKSRPLFIYYEEGEEAPKPKKYSTNVSIVPAPPKLVLPNAAVPDAEEKARLQGLLNALEKDFGDDDREYGEGDMIYNWYTAMQHLYHAAINIVSTNPDVRDIKSDIEVAAEELKKYRATIVRECKSKSFRLYWHIAHHDATLANLLALKAEAKKAFVGAWETGTDDIYRECKNALTAANTACEMAMDKNKKFITGKIASPYIDGILNNFKSEILKSIGEIENREKTRDKFSEFYDNTKGKTDNIFRTGQEVRMQELLDIDNEFSANEAEFGDITAYWELNAEFKENYAYALFKGRGEEKLNDVQSLYAEAETAYTNLERMLEAAGELEELATATFGRAGAALGCAKAQFQMGNTTSAKDSAKRALESYEKAENQNVLDFSGSLHHERAEAYYLLAQIMVKNGKTKDAEHKCHNALRSCAESLGGRRVYPESNYLEGEIHMLMAKIAGNQMLAQAAYRNAKNSFEAAKTMAEHAPADADIIEKAEAKLRELEGTAD